MTDNAIESSFRNNASLQVSEISGNNEFKLVRFSDANRNAIQQLANQWKSNDTILFKLKIFRWLCNRKKNNWWHWKTFFNFFPKNCPQKTLFVVSIYRSIIE